MLTGLKLKNDFKALGDFKTSCSMLKQCSHQQQSEVSQ